MENIPEKFRKDDGTLNADALIKSYLGMRNGYLCDGGRSVP